MHIYDGYDKIFKVCDETKDIKVHLFLKLIYKLP